MVATFLILFYFFSGSNKQCLEACNHRQWSRALVTLSPSPWSDLAFVIPMRHKKHSASSCLKDGDIFWGTRCASGKNPFEPETGSVWARGATVTMDRRLLHMLCRPVFGKTQFVYTWHIERSTDAERRKGIRRGAEPPPSDQSKIVIRRFLPIQLTRKI